MSRCSISAVKTGSPQVALGFLSCLLNLRFGLFTLGRNGAGRWSMTASVATSMKKEADFEAAVSAASLAMRALRTADVISSIRNASKPVAPGLLILGGLGKWQGGRRTPCQ